MARRSELPRRSTTHAMRASLLAKATTAAFLCTRANSPRSQPPIGVALVASAGITDRAPWMRSLRRYLLPRLVMPTNRGLPPVVIWRGTKPSQAARSRPARKDLGVADGGHQRGRVQHADAGDRGEPPRIGVVSRPRGELVVE